MEIRELLSFYEFDGDNTPIIRGSALGALNGDAQWVDTVTELMTQVDEFIPIPPRLTDLPFLMPVEDVFSITGRGTVATGRIERGQINASDQVDIIGMGEIGEHTSELQSLMRISYAVFCLKKKNKKTKQSPHTHSK